MAGGTIYGGTVANGYRLEIDWTATPNTSSNSSSVTSKVYIKSLGSGYDLYVTRSGTSTVDGSSASYSAASNLSGNGRTLLYTHTKTVTHGNDGKKSIGISANYVVNVSLGGGGYVGTLSASQTVALDTIPRASSLAVDANWTAGSSKYITISRASSSFVHSVYLYVNDRLIKQITNLPHTTTVNWTVTENNWIFSELNGTASKPTRINVVTYEYAGGAKVGEKNYYGTCTAPAATSVSGSMDLYRYIDESFDVVLSSNHSSFTHKLDFTFGSFSISQNGVSTSHTWNWTTTQQNTLYAQIPDKDWDYYSLKITTYYDGVQVRSPITVSGTLNVRNADPSFANTQFTYSDTNATISGLTGNNQWIVQNKSNLKAVINSAASAQKGASITKYIATIAGESITVNSPFTYPITLDFATINAASNQNLTITAYDSRGKTAAAVKTVNVVAWSPPVIKSTATRTNGFLNETTLTLSGSISPVNVNGTNKNSLVAADVKYRYRKIGGAWSAYVVFLGQVLTMPNYVADSTLINGSTGLDNTSAWEVEVYVKDKFGNNVIYLPVGAGQPIMHVDDVKKSVGIGKFPSFSNGLDVNGDFAFSGKMISNIHMNNMNITNLNHLTFNDVGSGEGIEWLDSSNNWKIVVSPDNLTNNTGDLQIVHNNVRKFTARGNGIFDASGLHVDGINVVSYGSNANGNWIKFYDGTMICYINDVIQLALSNNYPTGGLHWHNTWTWVYPVAFIVQPALAIGRTQWTTSASWGNASGVNAADCHIRVIDISQRASGNTYITAMAIGRWK